ncbi:hypothetical protein [Streptomyces sp. WAC06614]|uniref:hypothetical protein n=1 Tax=Streptomyces sp. WAC06614 TaxID=2487416 RepID=UPI000F781CF4|nr:hypothetical protein [Streptomyces sp. WAC06614]RSS81848.1 hypothetical protein EF918_08950 [Streptomyces sp. WAC06614]
MTDHAGCERPLDGEVDVEAGPAWDAALPSELTQVIMGHLPLEDRGRWSLTNSVTRAFAAAQPWATPAGQTQGLRSRGDLDFRTIYTQHELDESLNDPVPLHFAPGGGDRAEPLTLYRPAAGGTIRLVGGIDGKPLAELNGGVVDAFGGAVISVMKGGRASLCDATVTDKYAGYCEIWGGGTVVHYHGGTGHCYEGGTIVNHLATNYLAVRNGKVVNFYSGSADAYERSWFATVHGGQVHAWGDTLVEELTDGLVVLHESAALVSVRGGEVRHSSSVPITEVSGGVVELNAGAAVDSVTGGRVDARGGSAVHAATGGTVHVEARSVLHHAAGNTVVHAHGGSTVTAAGDAQVEAYDGSHVTVSENARVHAYGAATVIAHGGTVHLHGDGVQLADRGAHVITEL